MMRAEAAFVRWLALLGAAFTCLLAQGCPASGDAVRPDSGAFYFPTALAVDGTPGQAHDRMFVGSANSDLRFDSGVINTVDLASVRAVLDPWVNSDTVADGCVADTELIGALSCDEKQFVLGQSDALPGDAARIGNFITDIQVQRLDSGTLRLFAPVRGDPSVTWADFDPASGALACSENADFDRCDDEHRLVRLADADVPLSGEPFQVHVDGDNEYVVISHLSALIGSGVVSLVDAPATGDAPALVDTVPSGGNLLTGEASAVGIAGRTPGAPNNLIYVTSRVEAIVRTLVVTEVAEQRRLLPGPGFTLARVRDSNDARDLVFGQDGSRAYILNRNPPALHVLDTSIGDTGLPKNELLRVVALCDQPSRIALAEVEGRERVYISCFRASEVWTVDPEAGVPLAFTRVGRGPHAIQTVRHCADGASCTDVRSRVYVANTLEDTVSIIELERGQFENRVVMKIGRTRQSEANQ